MRPGLYTSPNHPEFGEMTVIGPSHDKHPSHFDDHIVYVLALCSREGYVRVHCLYTTDWKRLA